MLRRDVDVGVPREVLRAEQVCAHGELDTGVLHLTVVCVVAVARDTQRGSGGNLHHQVFGILLPVSQLEGDAVVQQATVDTEVEG